MRLALSLSLLALLTVCFSSSSQAGKNAGGRLVVHVNDAAIYTTGQDYCSSQWLPPSCVDAVTQSNASPEDEIVIWILANFPGGSSPAVTAVQFGLQYSMPPGQGYVPHWGPCGPSPLVLPDPGFPDVPGGTLIGYGQPVYDRFFSISWFGIYWNAPGDFFRPAVYPAIDQALFADDSVPPIIDEILGFGEVLWQELGENPCGPPPPQGACCYPDGTCEFVLLEECLGDFMGDYVPCSPDLCYDYTQACCLPDGSCYMVLPEECLALDGVPMGEGTSCDENPCGPEPYGACCFPNGSCDVRPDWDCDDGIFLGPNTDCEPDPCTQACCFDDGSCSDLNQETCASEGGQSMGFATACETTECIPVATEPSTWGQIKASYR